MPLTMFLYFFSFLDKLIFFQYISNFRMTTNDLDQVQRASGQINGSDKDFYTTQALYYGGYYLLEVMPTQFVYICGATDAAGETHGSCDVDLNCDFSIGTGCNLARIVKFIRRNWSCSILQRHESRNSILQCAVVLYVLVYKGGNGFESDIVRWPRSQPWYHPRVIRRLTTGAFSTYVAYAVSLIKSHLPPNKVRSLCPC
jgi:hypothetical protein